jgi:hypothetical protein
MLGAMMSGGRRFANRHDLLAGNLTVPAGVTSINLFAAASGGDAGANVVGGTWGGGGGGGGGAILNCAYTVAPGDIVSVALALSPTRWEMRVNGGAVQATISKGEAAGASDPRGGFGGSATLIATTANGGAQQSTPGAKGNAGQIVAAAGGTLIGGAGGGAGNTIAPSLAGGAGGDVGVLLGVAATTHWGGGGASYLSGASRLTSVTTSDIGTTFFFAEY